MSLSHPYFQRYRLFLNDPKLRRKRDFDDPSKPFVPIPQQREAEMHTSLETSYNQDSLNKKDMDVALQHIESFCSKVRSLESLTLSLKRKIDQSSRGVGPDGRKVEELVDNLSKKFRGADRFFEVIEDMRGQLLNNASPTTKAAILEGRNDRWANRDDSSMSRTRSRSPINEDRKIVDDLLQEKILTDRLKRELEAARAKYVVLSKENELLLAENKRLFEEVKSGNRAKEEGAIFRKNVHSENQALKEKVDLLLERLREVEKENALLKEKEVLITRENGKLEERVTASEQRKRVLEEREMTLVKENAQLKERARVVDLENKTLEEEMRRIISSMATIQRESDTLKERLLGLEPDYGYRQNISGGKLGDRGTVNKVAANDYLYSGTAQISGQKPAVGVKGIFSGDSQKNINAAEPGRTSIFDNPLGSKINQAKDLYLGQPNRSEPDANIRGRDFSPNRKTSLQTQNTPEPTRDVSPGRAKKRIFDRPDKTSSLGGESFDIIGGLERRTSQPNTQDHQSSSLFSKREMRAAQKGEVVSVLSTKKGTTGNTSAASGSQVNQTNPVNSGEQTNQTKPIDQNNASSQGKTGEQASQGPQGESGGINIRPYVPKKRNTVSTSVSASQGKSG